jgi:hypothetical protein
MAGNIFSSFKQTESKLVKLLDISMVKNMENAEGKYNMNQNIIDFSKDGGRIWRF